jgi:hypothetical protein
MKDFLQKILIDGKDFNSTIKDFLDFMRSENSDFHYGEPVLESTVGNFLTHVDAEIAKSIQNKKVKHDLAWIAITEEYEITKLMFSKKLKPFIDGDFKRHTILRDIGNSYSLMSLGFYKEAVVISGSVIEEILRLYLLNANMITKPKTFNDYIKICNDNDFFRKGINKLTDSVREFRNLVHLSKENNKKDVINKANAKNAINAVFSFYYEF